MAERPGRDRRLTEKRVAELHDELGELRARIEAIEQREDAGLILATALGKASLYTLNAHPRSKRGQT